MLLCDECCWLTCLHARDSRPPSGLRRWWACFLTSIYLLVWLSLGLVNESMLAQVERYAWLIMLYGYEHYFVIWCFRWPPPSFSLHLFIAFYYWIYNTLSGRCTGIPGFDLNEMTRYSGLIVRRAKTLVLDRGTNLTSPGYRECILPFVPYT